MKKTRPEQNISDKEALKALRRAKAKRKADFSKGMPCAKCGLLSNTEYDSLMPYYYSRIILLDA